MTAKQSLHPEPSTFHLPKMSMGDIGFYAQFQDTQNNVLALFQDPMNDD